MNPCHGRAERILAFPTSCPAAPRKQHASLRSPLSRGLSPRKWLEAGLFFKTRRLFVQTTKLVRRISGRRSKPSHPLDELA